MTRKVRIELARPSQPPFFEPWMGDRYRAVRQAALVGENSCCDGLWHIMGESHYGPPSEQRPDFTRSVVEGLALSGYRFFDTVLSIASDKPRDDVLSQIEWQRFAFSNFVQRVLPDDARRPAEHDWAEGRRCFFGQLAITRPKQLLVVGKSQWDQLPSEGYTPVEIKSPFDDRTIPDLGIYGYEVNGVVSFTVATWMYHPSSRGRLNVEAARLKLRAITMVSCNIVGSIGRDDAGWFIEDNA